MSKSISAALLGLGTVGYGVRRLLEENRGINIEIKKILVRQPEKHGDIDPGLLTTDLDGIISDPGIELVIEAMGAGAFGYAAIRRSLVSGKSVITADKEIVARHLPELSTLAEARDARFYFEAAAGGAVPVIRNLLAIRKYGRVESVAGIVNGTANYILTQMFRRDIDFASALAAAREAGFAEADPEDDVSGIDSARKIAILAALAYDVFVPSEHIYRYGIANITKEDIAFIKSIGRVVKLIAFARRRGETIEIGVEPTLVHGDGVFAGVEDEDNAIFIEGKASGNLGFSGKGAGRYPTAAAVLSDCLAYREGVKSFVFREDDGISFAAPECGQYYLRVADPAAIPNFLISMRRGNHIITGEIDWRILARLADNVAFCGKIMNI